MIYLLALAGISLALPATKTDSLEDATLVECRFGDAAANGSVNPNKKLAIMFASQLVGGRTRAIETFDPNFFLEGVVLDDVKIKESTVSLVGASRRPRPFITIFKDQPAGMGSYHAAVDYLDKDGSRLGYCFLFTGLDGKTRAEQVRKLNAEGAYK